MKRSYFCLLLLVIAIKGAGVNANAAEPPVATMNAVDLDALIGEALTNNIELRVFEASIQSAKGEMVTARMRPNPEASFTPGVKRIPGDVMFKGTFSAAQLIEFPGKRDLRAAIAARGLGLSELALEGFRHQLRLTVRKAFYSLIAAQQVIRLREEQVESASVFRQSAQKRVESGIASDFEIIKADAELIVAQKLLRESQGKVSSAKVILNSLAGRPPTAPLRISGALEGTLVKIPSVELVSDMVTNNPALRLQLIQIEKAQLNTQAVRLSRKPDFTVGPTLELARDEQIFGFSVSIPLPFWNKKQGEIQTAMADEDKALAEIGRLKAEISRAAAVALGDLQAAEDQLTLYTPDFRHRLKALVDLAERSYAQSATTLLIFLDSKRTYFEAQTDYYELLSKVAEAHAELESAIGVPLLLEPLKQ